MVSAQHLADARWGRALLGIFPIAFFVSQAHRIVQTRRKLRD